MDEALGKRAEAIGLQIMTMILSFSFDNDIDEDSNDMMVT
jgi:hypothetical protein